MGFLIASICHSMCWGRFRVSDRSLDHEQVIPSLTEYNATLPRSDLWQDPAIMSYVGGLSASLKGLIKSPTRGNKECPN